PQRARPLFFSLAQVPDAYHSPSAQTTRFGIASPSWVYDPASGGSQGTMNIWDVAIWVRFHWFELAALALLLANLWFVFGILNVLRAINEALVFLSGRSDRTD